MVAAIPWRMKHINSNFDADGYSAALQIPPASTGRLHTTHERCAT
jgi:hypothetical protein